MLCFELIQEIVIIINSARNSCNAAQIISLILDRLKNNLATNMLISVQSEDMLDKTIFQIGTFSWVIFME